MGEVPLGFSACHPNALDLSVDKLIGEEIVDQVARFAVLSGISVVSNLSNVRSKSSVHIVDDVERQSSESGDRVVRQVLHLMRPSWKPVPDYLSAVVRCDVFGEVVHCVFRP